MLNGGINDWDAIERELAHVDGVMLGRVAYHDPYFLAQAGARLFGDEAGARSRADVLHALVPYAQSQLARACRFAPSRGTFSGSTTAAPGAGASGRSCRMRRN